jgi:hypothetical protein
VCPSKYDPETYVQAGIVAWGIGCGEDGTPGVYASVSKAACWIDSVISCHQGAATGDYNSYFGYTSNVCQTWQDQKIATLIQQRDSAGKFGRIFEALIQKYQTCTVHWQAPVAPVLDVSGLSRDQTGVYTDTNEDQTDRGYTAVDSSTVKIIEDTYTDDSSDLVKDDGYTSPQTSDLIDEDLSAQQTAGGSNYK